MDLFVSFIDHHPTFFISTHNGRKVTSLSMTLQISMLNVASAASLNEFTPDFQL